MDVSLSQFHHFCNHLFFVLFSSISEISGILTVKFPLSCLKFDFSLSQINSFDQNSSVVDKHLGTIFDSLNLPFSVLFCSLLESESLVIDCDKSVSKRKEVFCFSGDLNSFQDPSLPEHFESLTSSKLLSLLSLDSSPMMILLVRGRSVRWRTVAPNCRSLFTTRMIGAIMV